jgi:hypothetical protein
LVAPLFPSGGMAIGECLGLQFQPLLAMEIKWDFDPICRGKSPTLLD